jgi:hypothetical protein
VPESFGKRQRRDARDKKTAAREERRGDRNKQREERASCVLEAGTPLAPSDVTERQRTPRAAAAAAIPTRQPSPTGTGGTRARSPFLAVASPGGGEHLAAVQRPPVPPRELLEAEVGTSWRMPNAGLLGLSIDSR